MPKCLMFVLAVCLLSLPVVATADAAQPASADALSVLPPQTDGVAPRDMMTRYLLGQVDNAQRRWAEAYQQRKTPEQIAEYQKQLKERFVEALGGFPERTPLNPRVVGKLQRDGYHVEKVIFESQPKHFVTAALFLPDPKRFEPPYPGVLVPCGHSANGKALVVYQKACALAALNGLAAMIFDPIDQGERHQLLDARGKARLASCAGHNMVGTGSMLLGRNTARFEIWDGMRGIDYLQSRPEIDPKRIGCTGNSGGGTQTAYFMALDDRIACAAPSCYICGLFGRLLRHNGAQDAEQNIFGQLAWGMDHADYCMMRAPRPTLLCTATHDFFNIEDAWTTFRAAKRLYARLGYAERMSLVETDQPHGFSLRLREGAVHWMLRWLEGRDVPVAEPPDLKVPTDAEIQCTPRGEVMLLDGARSVYDLNRDYEKDLIGRRKKLWAETPRAEMLDRVRQLAGIRPLAELPRPKLQKLGTIARDGYHIEKLVFTPEAGIWLPALWFVADGAKPRAAVLYVHAEGKAADAAPGGPIERLVRQGRNVLAVDLRGIGETQRLGQRYFNPALHGPDGQDFYIAYLLGRTYVGMRTEDLMLLGRWLGAQSGAQKPGPVDLVAVGHLGTVALHAAALEPALFTSVRLVHPLVSWSNVVQLGYNKNPLVNNVHAALTTYDLPDLAKVIGKKLSVEEPLDAMGEVAR